MKYSAWVCLFCRQVDITWDETDHDRVTSLSKAFKKDELLDMDFQAYLASSSEEEEEEQGTSNCWDSVLIKHLGI